MNKAINIHYKLKAFLLQHNALNQFIDNVNNKLIEESYANINNISGTCDDSFLLAIEKGEPAAINRAFTWAKTPEGGIWGDLSSQWERLRHDDPSYVNNIPKNFDDSSRERKRPRPTKWHPFGSVSDYPGVSRTSRQPSMPSQDETHRPFMYGTDPIIDPRTGHWFESPLTEEKESEQPITEEVEKEDYVYIDDEVRTKLHDLLARTKTAAKQSDSENEELKKKTVKEFFDKNRPTMSKIGK